MTTPLLHPGSPQPVTNGRAASLRTTHPERDRTTHACDPVPCLSIGPAPRWHAAAVTQARGARGARVAAAADAREARSGSRARARARRAARPPHACTARVRRLVVSLAAQALRDRGRRRQRDGVGRLAGCCGPRDGCTQSGCARAASRSPHACGQGVVCVHSAAISSRTGGWRAAGERAQWVRWTGVRPVRS